MAVSYTTKFSISSVIDQKSQTEEDWATEGTWFIKSNCSRRLTLDLLKIVVKILRRMSLFEYLLVDQGLLHIRKPILIIMDP